MAEQVPFKSDEEMAVVYEERRGDEIYPTVKHLVNKFEKDVSIWHDRFVDFIQKDSMIDKALSQALDTVGKVLEYEAQADGKECPEFQGGHLIRDFQRVSKLKTVLDLAELLELSPEAQSEVLRAEVDRLWVDPTLRALRNKDNKKTPTDSKQDDLVTALKSIQRALEKKKG